MRRLAVRDYAEEVGNTDVLSRQQFIRRIHLEKRRTDRSKAPLSLVLFNAPVEHRTPDGNGGALVDLLRQSTRESDQVGYLDEGLLGLLMPYTDCGGVSGFLRRFEPLASGLDYATTTGTYPDQIFETVMAVDQDRPETLPHFLEYDTGHSDLEWMLKRSIDVVGAVALLLILGPVMLMSAVAIKATSPGPVLFSQMRLGRKGVPFRFYKFRSMVAGADERVHREYVASLIEGRHDDVNQGGADEPIYKLQRDARITRIGALLRRSSLDELPQLFNVLKGDMSLVGPRPPIPYEVERYQSWHLRRVLESRPGITGLWQVEGRNRVSFDEMVRLDLRYARTWSLWLDIKILLKTVVAVFRFNGDS